MKQMIKENEIKWITGLKGVCAVSVVLLHMLACFYSDVIAGSITISRLNTYNFITFTPINIIFNGSFAVYVFWIISAYLLAYSWYTKYDIKDMQRKILNKYFRLILPIAVTTLLAFCIIKMDFYYHEVAGSLIGDSFFTNERDFNNMTIYHVIGDLVYDVFFTGYVDIIPPLWTMHIEFLGSLITVLFLLIMGSKKHAWILEVLLLPIMFSGADFIVYCCFLMGVILAQYQVFHNKANNTVGIICLIVGTILGGYPPSCVPSEGLYRYIYVEYVEWYNMKYNSVMGVHSLYVIAATLIVFGVLNSSILQKIYSNRLFYYLGKNSFYIYLIHIPILFTLNAFLFVYSYNKLGRYNVSVLLSCLVTMIVIFAVSSIFRIFSDKILNPCSATIVDKLMENKEIEC